MKPYHASNCFVGVGFRLCCPGMMCQGHLQQKCTYAAGCVAWCAALQSRVKRAFRHWAWLRRACLTSCCEHCMDDGYTHIALAPNRQMGITGLSGSIRAVTHQPCAGYAIVRHRQLFVLLLLLCHAMPRVSAQCLFSWSRSPAGSSKTAQTGSAGRQSPERLVTSLGQPSRLCAPQSHAQKLLLP